MRILTLYIGLVCFVLVSCKKEGGNCIESTGKIVTEQRQIPYFNSLKMLDNVDVELISGDENKIEVTAGENIIDNIFTQVVDIDIKRDSVSKMIKQLVIQNVNQCNWLRSYDKPIKVKITYANNINNIEYRSIGDLICLNTIKSDTFYIDIFEGSGKINLELQCLHSHLHYFFGTADLIVKGRSYVNYLHQASYGPIHASELITDFNYLENRGSNDCYVHASIYLGATISSVGNIYYSGNPAEKELKKIGSGNFYELE
ncbi:MAG: hypothetical protein HOO86_13720 [Bacteroidales bacterium]|nr:hypothetical protein [Bacteroidales bacterium]